MLEKFTCVYVLITCVVADESDDGNAEDVMGSVSCSSSVVVTGKKVTYD